jgi:hypothetical protein
MLLVKSGHREQCQRKGGFAVMLLHKKIQKNGNVFLVSKKCSIFAVIFYEKFVGCIKHINCAELQLTCRLLPVSCDSLSGKVLYFIKLNTLIYHL